MRIKNKILKFVIIITFKSLIMSTQTKAEKATSKEILNTVKEEAKKETIIKQIEKFKPEPFKSAQDRILRKNQFDELAKRYEKLKEKDNELKMFHAGNDKTHAKIIFTNSQNFEFSIQNSNVIERLIKAAQEELTILLNEAENEVLTFEI